MSTTAFADWMAATQARVENALARHLPPAESIPACLHDAMRYATLGGGKRVRPLLAFAAGELSGATPEKLEIVACAVELIHAYSLVHDDLPCFDNAATRRGRASVHQAFGERLADRHLHMGFDQLKSPLNLFFVHGVHRKLLY